MKRTLLILCVACCGILEISAQRKSDLITENQELKYQLDSIRSTIATARQNERIAVQKSEAMQEQVTELQDANATLLKNLNSFSTLSKQNSENINKTLESLEKKEAQLGGMVNAMSAHDSTAVVVLTHAKRELGENAQVQVMQGGLIVLYQKMDFFFDNGTGTEILGTSKEWLAKVARILTAHPEAMITVEGLSNTGELNLALQQAAVVGSALIKDGGITGERILAQGMDGGFKDGIQIRIHPNYKGFYESSRNDLKK